MECAFPSDTYSFALKADTFDLSPAQPTFYPEGRESMQRKEILCFREKEPETYGTGDRKASKASSGKVPWHGTIASLLHCTGFSSKPNYR